MLLKVISFFIPYFLRGRHCKIVAKLSYSEEWKLYARRAAEVVATYQQMPVISKRT